MASANGVTNEERELINQRRLAGWFECLLTSGQRADLCPVQPKPSSETKKLRLDLPLKLVIDSISGHWKSPRLLARHRLLPIPDRTLPYRILLLLYVMRRHGCRISHLRLGQVMPQRALATAIRTMPMAKASRVSGETAFQSKMIRIRCVCSLCMPPHHY